MKRTQISLVLAGLMAALVSGQAMAADATATVTAKVITPIAVTKTTDMVLGNLVVGNGVVTLNTSGARTQAGSTPLSTSGSSPAAAEFTVTGEGANTFAIAYTGSSTSLSDGGTNTMAIDFITEAVAATATGKTDASTDATTGTLTTGSAKIFAGAAVTVGASQAAGTYTGSLVVTVAYN